MLKFTPGRDILSSSDKYGNQKDYELIGLILKPDVSIGDIITVASVLISLVALLISWNRDRQLKRKEYADKIRRSAGTIASKLERWRELSLRFYEDIQPLLTDIDTLYFKDENIIEARDALWRGLVDARTKSSQRIMDEQIELAYIDLYGYDPRIQTIFSEAIMRLKTVDEAIYVQVLNLTQACVLQLHIEEDHYTSAILGNKLRNTCFELSQLDEILLNETIFPFNQEMIGLIQTSDDRIVSKDIYVKSSQEIFPISLNNQKEKIKHKAEEILSTASFFNEEWLTDMDEFVSSEQFFKNDDVNKQKKLENIREWKNLFVECRRNFSQPNYIISRNRAGKRPKPLG